MKKVDMAYTAKEKKARNEPSKTMEYTGPDYPYGLSIRLEDEHLKKLGMDTLPKVGATVMLEATCKVISVSKNESERGKPHRCVELQMQQIALDNDADDSMEGAIKRGAREAD